MSVIYWVRNTKTDVELVLPKHDILSPKEEVISGNTYSHNDNSVNHAYQATQSNGLKMGTAFILHYY